MNSNPESYKPGTWILLGTVIGAVIGLLFGKFAIGLIFGFFVGVAIDSRKRKAAASASDSQPDGRDNTKP